MKIFTILSKNDIFDIFIIWTMFYSIHVCFVAEKMNFQQIFMKITFSPPFWFIDAQISTVVANKNSSNFRFLYGIFWNFTFLCFSRWIWPLCTPPPSNFDLSNFGGKFFHVFGITPKIEFFSNNFVQNVKLKMDNFEAVKSHRTDNISGILSYWFQFEGGGVAKWSNASGKVKKWQKYKWNLENSVIIVNF